MAEKLEQKIVDGEIVDNETDVTNATDDGIVDDGTGDGTDGSEDGEEVEAWMADGDQTPSDVPVSTHIRMKQKLKGRLSDKNEEVERLKQENETLKAGLKTQEPSLESLPKRPRENDYETLQEYDDAMVKFEDSMLQIRLKAANQKTEIQKRQNAAKADLETAVDAHYGRAAKLIQDNSIDTEVYKKADLIVRETIETAMPGQGDSTADQIISVIGDGSEKVIYYLGRNKKALGKFKDLLLEDPSGLRASMFLGQQRERLLNTKRKTSKAPAPDTDITGDDTPTSAKASAFLKKRKAAIKKGDVQAAYDTKKAAKAAGVDVSNW